MEIRASIRFPGMFKLTLCYSYLYCIRLLKH